MKRLKRFFESSENKMTPSRKSEHRKNIATIVDQNNDLHRRLVNSIRTFLIESGVKKIYLPYRIPYMDHSVIKGVDSDGFVILVESTDTKMTNNQEKERVIDMNRVDTNKLIEVYESLVH